MTSVGNAESASLLSHRRTLSAAAQKGAPALTLAQACQLLAAALPRRELTPEEALRLVRYTQLGNHRAKLSHYRRAARASARDGPE